MNCKEAIRREMVLKRKELDLKNGEEFSRIIRELDCYKNAKTVMVYYPIKGEADVTGIMTDEKVFVAPVTKKDVIYAARATKTEEGLFGTREPEDKSEFDKTKIDVVLVPGVAFDRQFNRMGFGRGYYDRFLDGIDAVKIGVCHSFQMLNEIPSETHDVKMDMIVTEREVWSRESI